MTEMIPAMPAEIAEGVNGVCSNVKKAIKDHRNTHGGGYAYASVDTFYEDMGPLLSEAGLFIMMDEARAESDGKWLMLTFNIYLYHKSGKAFGPVVRTQGVLANGPQAYAAAQSYAEKYFLRQLFKIPTGEKEADADSQPKEAIPASKKSESHHKVSASNSAQDKQVALMAISMAQDIAALDKWAVDNKVEMDRLTDKDVAEVRLAFKAKHNELKQQKEDA